MRTHIDVPIGCECILLQGLLFVNRFTAASGLFEKIYSVWLDQDRKWKDLVIVLQFASCIIVHRLVAFCAPEAWRCWCVLVLIGDLRRIPGNADAAFLPSIGSLHMQQMVGTLSTGIWQTLMSNSRERCGYLHAHDDGPPA